MTTTLIQSDVSTSIILESSTTTASTETSLFIITTTNMVTVTSTATATATDLTSTTVANPSTSYVTTWTYMPDLSSKRAAAEPTPVPLPEYASEVCGSWERYISACASMVVNPFITTITPTVTVTTTASQFTTTIFSTQLTTQIDTSTATATISTTTTTTAADPVITTVTESTTTTVSETRTLTAAAIPTETVPLICRPKGEVFRLRTTQSGNGLPSYLVVEQATSGITTFQWKSYGTSVPVGAALLFIDDNGLLRRYGSGRFHVAFTDRDVTDPAAELQAAWPQLYNANQPRMVGVAACIEAATGKLRLLGDQGRSTLLSCGAGYSAYLTSDSGNVEDTCTVVDSTEVEII